MKPDISIITVNLNGEEHLKEFFDSLKNQTFKSFEFILVDNNSTDGSIVTTLKVFPDAKIVKLDKNYGFAKPNNLGLERAEGKYIVTLNNDIVLEPNFLEELYNCAENSGDHLFGLSSKMIFYYDKNLLNTIGVVPLMNGNAVNLAKNEDPKLYTEKIEIFGPCAGAALYKKSVLDKIGFFDSEYFAYLEDVDLAHRAQKSGYKSYFCPTAVCYHKHSQTSSKFPFLKLYLIERNRLINLKKHYPWYYFFFESFTTLYMFLQSLLNKNKNKKLSSSQREVLKISYIPRLILIYIKARLYFIRKYARAVN